MRSKINAILVILLTFLGLAKLATVIDNNIASVEVRNSDSVLLASSNGAGRPCTTEK